MERRELTLLIMTACFRIPRAKTMMEAPPSIHVNYVKAHIL